MQVIILFLSVTLSKKTHVTQQSPSYLHQSISTRVIFVHSTQIAEKSMCTYFAAIIERPFEGSGVGDAFRGQVDIQSITFHVRPCHSDAIIGDEQSHQINSVAPVKCAVWGWIAHVVL